MPLLLSSFQVSRLNPLHFTQKGFTPLPQYSSKHLDDYPYPETAPSWSTAPEFMQPFKKRQRLQLQMFSQVAPVIAFLYDEAGSLVYQQNFQQKQQSVFQPTWFIYELDWDLSIFDEGIYHLEVQFGTDIQQITLVSNTFFIQETIDGSFLIEYSHYREKDGIFFETGFKTSVCTLGSLVYEDQGSTNIIYDDQILNPTLISSKSWDLWRFYIGDSAGIPDFQVPMWRMIFGCQNVAIDGRLYTRADQGTQLEKKEEDGYELKGWSIQLRERYNLSSRKWNTDALGGEANIGLNVIVTVETKGFFADDNGGSYYNVPDIE